MTKQLSLAMYARLSRGKGKGKGVGANHPIKYKQDAARRGRVEGLLRAPQAATIRPIYLITEHS